MDKIIRPMGNGPFSVRVPGSKSMTHRMLVAASLALGDSVIENALNSRDTELTREGLSRMGAEIGCEGARFTVKGCGGNLKPYPDPIYLENSGTSMRLLSAVAALGKGSYILTGSKRMRERPVGDLLSALNALGVSAEALSPGGCPPVRISCRPISSDHVYVDCAKSSQFLSALLLIAPYTTKGLTIEVPGALVSKPYVDMTVSVMETFGVPVTREGYQKFSVSGKNVYLPGDYVVEPDASAASYFFAAGAVSGVPVTVEGVSRSSAQGDMRLLGVLEKMGATVRESKSGVTVTGGKLKGVTVDMADMPDVAPTLAAVAAYAEGVTRVDNVGHLAVKESNRLTSVVRELSRMGIEASTDGESLEIRGGTPRPAAIEVYDDHRMAMSFAVMGLRAPGTLIREADCVKKSFPDFWDEWEKLYG